MQLFKNEIIQLLTPNVLLVLTYFFDVAAYIVIYCKYRNSIDLAPKFTI